MSGRRGLALRIAWRDGRGSVRRLALSALTVVVGVAALVAVRSFALDLQAAVDVESKALLGADLEITSRQPFDAAAEALFARIGGEQVREISLASMAYFPRTGGSRLVQVRAVDPGYPFYGAVETEPRGQAAFLHERAGALVDRSLLLQMGVRPGDRVRIGELELPVLAALARLPGEVPSASLIGPRVLVPRPLLEATGLVQPGSRIRYAVQFRLAADPEEIARLVEELRPELRSSRLDAETVASRQRLVARGLDDLQAFLALTALAALLLGAVGAASAAAVHARRHRDAVAILRCLGARRRLPIAAYALQALVMAGTGVLAGGLAGIAVQRLLPSVLAPFLPLRLVTAVRPLALLEAGGVGLVTVGAFALLPLLSLRRVRPLAALRAEVGTAPGRDPLAMLAPAPLLLLLVWLSRRQTGSWMVAAGLVVGFAAMLAALGAAAWALRALARRFLAERWPWELRQGVANLYRPHNQTLVMVLALGSGVFLVAALVLVGQGILASLGTVEVAGGADMVLFDVQPDQLGGVTAALEDAGVRVLDQLPVVPMRLASHKGRRVADVDDEEISRWSLRREYNSTYRGELSGGEQIVEGEWVAEASLDDGGPVPISLEEGIARPLDVEPGDELSFDVQGLEIAVRVASVRRVDWQQVRPNFLVVFPRGVLEGAPQQIVILGQAGGPAASAAAQRRIVEAFPNVSVLDLALVLRTVDDVLANIRAALRFLAAFVVLSGIAVLAAATLEGRSERQREGILLRTLGASRRQIARVGLAEFLLLGMIAAGAGIGLALAGALVVLRAVFELPLQPAPAALAGIAAAALTVTGVLGVWNGQAMSRRSVMELIRQS